jgi:hypothetical protein
MGKYVVVFAGIWAPALCRRTSDVSVFSCLLRNIEYEVHGSATAYFRDITHKLTSLM